MVPINLIIVRVLDIAHWHAVSLLFFGVSPTCICDLVVIMINKIATQKVTLTKFGMFYVKNVLCVLFLVPVAYLQGEVAIVYGLQLFIPGIMVSKTFLQALLASFRMSPPCIASGHQIGYILVVLYLASKKEQ